jgi:hypothetical protein
VFSCTDTFTLKIWGLYFDYSCNKCWQTLWQKKCLLICSFVITHARQNSSLGIISWTGINFCFSCFLVKVNKLNVLSLCMHIYHNLKNINFNSDNVRCKFNVFCMQSMNNCTFPHLLKDWCSSQILLILKSLNLIVEPLQVKGISYKIFVFVLGCIKREDLTVIVCVSQQDSFVWYFIIEVSESHIMRLVHTWQYIRNCMLGKLIWIFCLLPTKLKISCWGMDCA